VEFTYRAGGLGIFGGYGHRVHHNLFKDGTDVSGLRFTEDFGGYHFANNTGIYVYENTLVARGTSLDVWNGPRGAIEVAGAGVRNLFFENNEILNSPRHAIQLQGGTDLFFTNTLIAVTGLDRYSGPGGAAIRQFDFGGSATFRPLVMTDIENQPPVIKEVPAYTLVIDNQFPVTDHSTLIVPEGGTAGFGVSLSFQPASPVTVSVVRTSGDANIQVVGGAGLIFSAVNWSNLQTVMLAAEEDADTSEGSAQILCRAVGWGDTLVTAMEFENDLNHAPVAEDDLALVDEESSLTLAVLANDYDVDGQPLSIFTVTAGAHGAVTHNGTQAGYTPSPGLFRGGCFFLCGDGRPGRVRHRSGQCDRTRSGDSQSLSHGNPLPRLSSRRTAEQFSGPGEVPSRSHQLQLRAICILRRSRSALQQRVRSGARLRGGELEHGRRFPCVGAGAGLDQPDPHLGLLGFAGQCHATRLCHQRGRVVGRVRGGVSRGRGRRTAA
jgi:hypothetical protein